MKKTLVFLSLLFVMVAFTQSTSIDTNPFLVTLYERMILYQNCQNLVGTSVPALGANYHPVFTTNNGMIVPKENIGDVVVIPNNLENCKLAVSSKGKEVGNCEFKVLPVPAPNVLLADETGREISIIEPVKKGTYRVFPRPDANFIKTMPREATYVISEMTLNVFNKGQKISSSKNDFTFDLKDTQAGDMIQIIINKAQRINSLGKLEDVIPVNPCINFMVTD